MSEPSLPVVTTGVDNPLRVEPDTRRQPDGSASDLPLPAALLKPIGEGIASCPALWEPLAGHALAGPVHLFATDGYDVWLEAHPPGTRLEPRRPDATHTLTLVRGSVRLRPPAGVDRGASAVIAVVPGGTSVVATATDTVIENPGHEVALAIHVRSAVVARAQEVRDEARFPASVAGMLSHPARSRRSAPDDRSTLTAVGGRS